MSTLHINRSGSGIVLKYGSMKIALDTYARGAVTFLSHSHSDHIVGIQKAKHIVATRGTFETLAARGQRLGCSKSIVRYNETLGQIGVYVTALNAGHVIGSSMFLFEFDDGMKVLYTGDFNNVDSIVHKAAAPVNADVLITEATFGTPSWVFPDREQVHFDIVEKAKTSIEKGILPFFQAYSLGKAQEAIALLQNNGFNVVSGNKTIDSVNEVYNKYGNDLDFISIEEEEMHSILEQDCVVITSSPKHTNRNFQKIIGRKKWMDFERRIQIYKLSGWALGQYGTMGFPLSAHSDYPGLVDFAQNVEPRVTYCFTSNATTLSNQLNSLGIQALPLE